MITRTFGPTSHNGLVILTLQTSEMSYSRTVRGGALGSVVLYLSLRRPEETNNVLATSIMDMKRLSLKLKYVYLFKNLYRPLRSSQKHMPAGRFHLRGVTVPGQYLKFHVTTRWCVDYTILMLNKNKNYRSRDQIDIAVSYTHLTLPTTPYV